MTRFVSKCALMAVVVLGASSFATTALADNSSDGGWEFTLGGTGIANQDVKEGSFSGDASIGFFLGPMIELGARQSVTYSDIDPGGQAWSGSSRFFGDFQFNFGRLAPFVGANIGYIYGDGVHDTMAAAPEVGLKFYVGKEYDAFIYGRLEYQFFFDKGDEIDDVADDGQFVAGVGIGLRF